MRQATSKTRGARGAAGGGQSGFSILELLITTALFIIVTGAVYGMLRVAASDRFMTNQRVEIMQSARTALNAIGRDALNAGNGFPREGARLPDNAVSTVNGLVVDSNAALDILPPVIPGRLVNPNNLSGANTDQITFLYQDLTFNNALPVNITVINASGSQITINPAGPDGILGNGDDVNNGIFGANNIIMITGLSIPAGGGPGIPASAVGMVTAPPGGAANTNVYFATTAPIALNLPGALTSGIPTINSGTRTATRVAWIRYRVLQNGTLVRTVVGNIAGAAGTQDQPLAYNIEGMAVEYVMADGTTSVNPGAGIDGILGNGDDTPANLFNVRQVRVTLTARSPEPDPRNNQIYRATLTSTFNTRNLGYDTR